MTRVTEPMGPPRRAPNHAPATTAAPGRHAFLIEMLATQPALAGDWIENLLDRIEARP